MPGEAKSSKFMLGSATVMVGASLTHHDLTVADNSIGLVKNFAISGEPTYVELTQGVKNTIVDSAINSNPIRCTMEWYEATGKNIKYALGLDGSAYASDVTEHTIAANVAVDATTLTVAGDITGSMTGDVAVGEVIEISEGSNDYVHYAKVSAIAYSSPNTTVTFANHPTPIAFTTAGGAKFRTVNYVEVGAVDDQPYLAAKVVGKLSDGTKVTVVIPKMRIVKGFNLSFVTDQYANMPVEFTPYELTAAERVTAKMMGSSGVAEIYTV